MEEISVEVDMVTPPPADSPPGGKFTAIASSLYSDSGTVRQILGRGVAKRK